MTRARRARRMRALLGVAVLALLGATAGGCGGGTQDVVRPPSSTSPSTSAAPTTSSSIPRPGARQQISVTPNTALPSVAVVRVIGSGFSPNEALVVNECAAKGAATGPGDCNLAGITAVTADAHGKVSLRFRVTRGPFGANRIVCSAAQPCLVSVSQATISPTEEADAPIAFG